MLFRSSPAFWVPLVGGLQGLVTRPFLSFCGGTPPTAPRHGGFAPLDPPLPTLVGFGFASVFGGVNPSASRENPAKFSPFPRREGGQGVRSEKHTLARGFRSLVSCTRQLGENFGGLHRLTMTRGGEEMVRV